MRADNNLGREMTDKLRQSNVAYLQGQNIETTPGAQYLAHFLGANGAAAVLKADANMPVADALIESVGAKAARQMIAANPSILQGQQSGSVVAWAEKKMGGGSVYGVLRPDQRVQLEQHAIANQRAIAADQQRQITIDKQQAEFAANTRESDIIKDAFSDSPKITVQDVANDSVFNRFPIQKERIIRFLANPPGMEPAAGVSHANAADLLDRIRKPEGDRNKIVDVNPIYDAYLKNKISKSDFQFVRNEFTQLRTPDGQNFEKQKSDFLSTIKGQLDKSTLIKQDESGKQAYYLFQSDLGKKIADYRQQGKDPRDLLDPDKPDFVGNPTNLTRYIPPLQAQISNIQHKINAPAGSGSRFREVYGGSVKVELRKPGESIADWKKRTGQ